MTSRNLIIIPIFNQGKVFYKNLDALKNLNTDILIVDDGSTDTVFDIIKSRRWINYIKLETHFGIGAAIINGYEYARDMDYDVIFLLDLNNIKFEAEFTQLVENIQYGFDIVNSSRILENFDYKEIKSELVDITSDLSLQIKDITNFDITDPLSGIKAIRMEALKYMELTEYDHGIFLQIWIQANYFGLTVMEIPAQSGKCFGEELNNYEDPLGQFLSLMETEKFLYSKKNLN